MSEAWSGGLLDGDDPFGQSGVGKSAAPFPFFSGAHEAGFDRLGVHGREGGGSGFGSDDVGVGGTTFPDLLVGSGGAVVAAPIAGLEHFDGVGGGVDFGLAHQQPEMIGHDDIADDGEAKLDPQFFEEANEDVAMLFFAEPGLLLETGAGYEVEVAFAIDGLAKFGHLFSLWGEQFFRGGVQVF